MKQLFKAHPWHGIDPGLSVPNELTAFIEIIPTDTVKYEIDKKSGYLKIDRPQRFSNVVPSLYGFIPRTYCAEEVASLCSISTGQEGIIGDGDPLDICVLTEKHIPHGDILVQAIPIGGFRMIDNHQADDKIIAVLKDDHIYGQFESINELPSSIIDRLHHYFYTYKLFPQSTAKTVEIAEIYDAETAKAVIMASMKDYCNHFDSKKTLS